MRGGLKNSTNWNDLCGITKAEIIGDNDALEELIHDEYCKDYIGCLFKTVSETEPNCSNGCDCWYENNYDRCGEYNTTMYHLSDPNIQYCDVCFMNGEFDGFDIPIDGKVFVPELRKALNKLKSFLK